jgi:hypothetical protein
VLIWRAGTFGLSGLLGLFVSGLGVQLPTTAVSVGFLVFGIRAFRGPDELDLPRPWWRMTYSSRWGVALAIAFAIFAAFTVSSLIHDSGSERVVDVLLLAVSSIAAIGYIHSSVRLARRNQVEDFRTELPAAEKLD